MHRIQIGCTILCSVWPDRMNCMTFTRRQILGTAVSAFAGPNLSAQSPLSISTFQADATPPMGSALCHGLVKPASRVGDPTTARGLILLGSGQPIVLCAVDWTGLGTDLHDIWRAELAKAVGTTSSRVMVHSLHQHDAPGCDFAMEKYLSQYGMKNESCDPVWARQVIARCAAAAKSALSFRQPVTHVGTGRGLVKEVAGNRRILGADGKVKYTRFSATKVAAVRAEPEGMIDPYVRLISFWNGASPIASVTFYATHPQSYYGIGEVSADFVGLARENRKSAVPQAAHIHFNGASGNVTAGKYNDGSPENRLLLAGRLSEGMRRAWDATEKQAISSGDVGWLVEPVMLAIRNGITAAQAHATLKDTNATKVARLRAGFDLAWIERAAKPVDLAMLRLGAARILFMPGELFIEYQLAAQQMKAQSFVAMAAYGLYGMGYIGTAEAYAQGGYETSEVSRVGPEVEPVLMEGMRKLLAS